MSGPREIARHQYQPKRDGAAWNPQGCNRCELDYNAPVHWILAEEEAQRAGAPVLVLVLLAVCSLVGGMLIVQTALGVFNAPLVFIAGLLIPVLAFALLLEKIRP